MSAVELRDLAYQLGGEVIGDQVLCPGPGHKSPRDRSLAVKPRGGDFLVHSFAGDDPLACLAYVRGRLGVARPETLVPPRNHCQPERPRSDAWRAIWAEACDPRCTLVERYLASRGLPLPACATGEALRFHPACPFGRAKTPAMVALVRDIRSNEPIGVHRTALEPAGRKIEIDGRDRMALGTMRGGVVKLMPDEELTYGLAIGEGIETTLSLWRLPEWGGHPAWACLSAGSLGDFPVLPGIDALAIVADHDETGLRAARAVTSRWYEAGRETMIFKPIRPGDDLNDLVVGS